MNDIQKVPPVVVEDLEGYLLHSRIASQYGAHLTSKSLDVVANITEKTFTYTVSVDRKIVLKTENIDRAVDCYNES